MPNVTKLVRGSGLVVQLDGFDYYRGSGESKDEENREGHTTRMPSYRHGEGRDPTPLEMVRNLNPIAEGEPGYYDAADDDFQTTRPERGGAFGYDAVVAAGVGARRAEADAKWKAKAGGGATSSSSTTGGDDAAPQPLLRRRLQGGKGPKPESLSAHFDGILQTKFTGATGRVQFGEKRGKSRLRESVTYGLYNVRDECDDETPGECSLGYSLTDIVQGSPIYGEGTWKTMPGGPFIFKDGSADPPILLRAVPDQNYLSRSVHIVGLTFFTLALALIIAAALFVFLCRKRSEIVASQPTFLYLIILGAAVMVMSIFTQSFDESFGWSQAMLDSACMATPWLLTLGYMVLYLYRINKVLQFRRRKVSTRAVAGPFVLLFFASITILSVWSAVDPYLWVRREVNAVTGETYGSCSSSNARGAVGVPLEYGIPLVVIAVIAAIQFSHSPWHGRQKTSMKSFPKAIGYFMRCSYNANSCSWQSPSFCSSAKPLRMHHISVKCLSYGPSLSLQCFY